MSQRGYLPGAPEQAIDAQADAEHRREPST